MIPPHTHKRKKKEKEWMNEPQIWQFITDLDEKNKALAVTLSFNGKTREIALNMEDLNQENGMDTLIFFFFF